MSLCSSLWIPSWNPIEKLAGVFCTGPMFVLCSLFWLSLGFLKLF